MMDRNREIGLNELREARRESRGSYWFVGIFSFFVNLLMLTGPLYMLQVYDRVLGSRSEATLVALTLLVAFLYGMMGILDFARGRVMSRVGAKFQTHMDRRVFEAVLRKSAVAPDERSASGLKDLESVQRLMTSPVLMAIFDIPWTPFFLFGIFIFHPWLGYLAISGGAILIAFALLNQLSTRRPVVVANLSNMQADSMSDQIRTQAEMIRSMGMSNAVFDRWQLKRNRSLRGQIWTADLVGMFSTLTKIFRLFLQSAMLGLGAYLVLLNELTPGAMIAGSILMGRALAPIELALNQWPLVQRARKGWDNLALLLGEVPTEADRTPLPTPRAKLQVQSITVIPPGHQQASLRAISFDLFPGQALGVIGQSGSGKSTLARAITGVWRPAGGKIRLDHATLDQYPPDVLGQHIGYLPQQVHLFEGTIAENIARMSEKPDPAKVVAAAKKAAAHEMILKLPDGYDTQMSGTSGQLSGGQIQRVGLARALYGDPVLLVLDEPNSNLDNEGSTALNEAIRTMKSEKKSVMIMAHRPAAIQECDMLLVLKDGARAAYGPRDEVLKSTVQNFQQIRASDGKGGGVS